MIISTVRISLTPLLRLRGHLAQTAIVGVVTFFALSFRSSLASPAPGPWVPIFKGIDHAVGTNDPSLPGNFPGEMQVAHCVRVDLTDPDVQLFSTPRASGYTAESRETLTQSVPHFLTQHQLQVVADANFYSANPGGSDPTAEGISCEVFGFQMSTGLVVSASAFEADPRYASILFTTNNQPMMAFVNRPPGTNTAGFFTAITGFYPIVSNGVNIGAAAINSYPDSSIHQTQPRTAFGVSRDNHYLFLMSIDGRQPGYSDGALDSETAYWMMQFGAWNAINMDGGGSTALYMADSTGKAVPLNHSSYVAAYGRERYIGSHFGVYAKPLPGMINDVTALPNDTSATIMWTTLQPGTSQVQYGLTANLGTFTPAVSDPVTNHVVLLSGLTPGAEYYFNAISTIGGTPYVSSNFLFVTTNYVTTNSIFDFTNTWKYGTANLDGVNWTAPEYDDSTNWDGSGPGLLWIDARGPNGAIPEPLNTQMPGDPSNALGPTYPFITYYFRTHFTFNNSVSGAVLQFTDYIDDGAVFYLNGSEIYRLRMPVAPAQIANTTLASGFACSGDATCPDFFTISGDLITNLAVGDNVLAAEVHNYNAGSPDITFGVALASTQPYAINPVLNFAFANGVLTLSWTGVGYTLQQAGNPSGPWTNAPGPIVTSPYTPTISGPALYFRLIK
jgi:hypothetical protein